MGPRNAPSCICGESLLLLDCTSFFLKGFLLCFSDENFERCGNGRWKLLGFDRVLKERISQGFC